MNIDDRPTSGPLNTFCQTSNGHISETHYPIHQYCKLWYTDHNLPSDSIMTVDAYHRSLDTYFARVVNYGIKRKNEKADLEKSIAREEYTLDWSQSKVCLVLS